MKEISLGSLRVRLTLLVLLVVIPTLGLILYMANVQRVVATGAAQENLSRIGSLTASEVSRVVEGAQQLLVGLAQFPEIRGGDAASCGTVMTKLLAIYPFYLTLAVASPDGNVICSAVSLTNSVTVNDQNWFQQAIQTRNFTVGEYQVDGLTGKESINLAYPIDEGGRIQSVVFAGLSLRYLNGRLNIAKLPDSASLVIADRRGAMLARLSGAGWEGGTAPESSLLKSASAYRGQGTAEIVGPDGVRRIYAFFPIGGKKGTADAYVSVSMPTAVALGDANRELKRNFLGLTVIALLALAGAWYGGHGIALRQANEELERRVQERTKELAHEQLLLRMLMDNMPDTIYFKDEQSRFTRVNRAQAEVLGLKSPDQAIGKSDSDFFPAEQAQAALADERRILESGHGLIAKTERIRSADGQFRWVTATKVPLRDNHGSVVGLVGISRDVTEHEKSEHLLRTLIDSLPDLVYVKDAKGRYVVVNSTHRAFLGLRSAEDIIGKTASDFYPREIAERIRKDDQAVLDAKIPVLNREEQFTNHRGEKTLVSTSKVPYRNEQGDIVGLVCISRIITGRN